MLRAWTTIARDSRVGPLFPSITSESTPRRCRTRPAISPVGPAPTTSTPVSSRGASGIVGSLSTRQRAVPWCHGRPVRHRAVSLLPLSGAETAQVERRPDAEKRRGDRCAQAHRSPRRRPVARPRAAPSQGRGGTPGAARRGVGCTPARVSGGGARQFAACPAGLPGLAGEVRGGGQIHLDDGVDVPVLPGGGVLRRAGGAGQVAQARALVAEYDEMLLPAVGMSVIGVLHGDTPSRPAPCRPDALMPAG